MMNLLPYLSIFVGILVLALFTFLKVTKMGVFPGLPSPTANSPSGLLKLKQNKFVLFLFVGSVLTLTAFGWNWYTQTIQLNLNSEETVNRH